MLPEADIYEISSVDANVFHNVKVQEEGSILSEQATHHNTEVSLVSV